VFDYAGVGIKILIRRWFVKIGIKSEAESRQYRRTNRIRYERYLRMRSSSIPRSRRGPPRERDSNETFRLRPGVDSAFIRASSRPFLASHRISRLRKPRRTLLRDRSQLPQFPNPKENPESGGRNGGAIRLRRVSRCATRREDELRIESQLVGGSEAEAANAARNRARLCFVHVRWRHKAYLYSHTCLRRAVTLGASCESALRARAFDF